MRSALNGLQKVRCDIHRGEAENGPKVRSERRSVLMSARNSDERFLINVGHRFGPVETDLRPVIIALSDDVSRLQDGGLQLED